MEDIKELANYCLNCKTKPCTKGCPLRNDIPGFIKYIKEDNFEAAYEVLCNTTVLPGICGRICPHSKQCEGNCVRGIKGEPVQIGKLEAYVADMSSNLSLKPSKEKLNKSVAIVGSGPAGLNCAAKLASLGVNVTIFEKDSNLGGLLIHGIPDFRLPKSTVNDTIQKILDLGVTVKYNSKLGVDFSLAELKEKFDATVLSVGANIPSKMGIPGEEFYGVFGANDLLEYQKHPDYCNKDVAIIGGGNVAMDAARTIKRLGANKVYVIYRRDELNMPAEIKEIEEAKNENIEFLFQTNLVKILGNDNNEVTQIECVKTELVSKENCSRKVPIDIEGSNFLLQMDFVVMAIGSKIDNNIINGLEQNEKGYLKVDENYMTSQKGIFAIGDLIGTKATVAWASKTGREAASSIVNYLENN